MKKLVFFVVCLFMFSTLKSQTDTIEHFRFNTGILLDGWTSTTSVITNWVFDSDGKAENATEWNDRPAIISPSDQGSSDDENGVAALEIDNPEIQNIVLTSPVINCGIYEEVFLRFNQYFGKVPEGSSTTIVEVSGDGGGSWTVFPIHDNDILSEGEETVPYNVQEIDISSVAAFNESVLIRFVMDGHARFWILDDIMVFSNRPVSQPISYIGDSLATFGKPYDIDDYDWPFVPYQIVVQFDETATDAEKQAIRDTFGFARIDSCVCNKLELWAMDGQGALSEPFPINERVMGVSNKSKVNSADVNKINFNALQNSVFSPLDTLMAVPGSTTATPADATIIAVLDTGIDFADTAPLTPNVWLNDIDDTFNGEDEDDSCYPDDFIGWNFVHRNNNPSDDHSHGTHVAGIIWMNLPDTLGCEYRILPIKTHDEDGVSNLFNVTCGTYYATQVGANIINDSWGAYGAGSLVLENAIDTAAENNILVVTSAGNDNLELGDDNEQFPASFEVDNVLTVGSYDLDSINNFYFHSNFSNYDSLLVDITAPGSNIISYVPGGGMDEKSGTSQATPAVSAAAAFNYCFMGANYEEAKKCLLACAIKDPFLEPYANEGKRLIIDPACLEHCVVPVEDITIRPNAFVLAPNPASESISIISKFEGKTLSLQITDISGKPVLQQYFGAFYPGEVFNVSLERMPAGMYFVQMVFDGYVWTEKLLKQ
jgi:hypothetical protein